MAKNQTKSNLKWIRVRLHACPLVMMVVRKAYCFATIVPAESHPGSFGPANRPVQGQRRRRSAHSAVSLAPCATLLHPCATPGSISEVHNDRGGQAGQKLLTSPGGESSLLCSPPAPGMPGQGLLSPTHNGRFMTATRVCYILTHRWWCSAMTSLHSTLWGEKSHLSWFGLHFYMFWWSTIGAGLSCVYGFFSIWIAWRCWQAFLQSKGISSILVSCPS